MGTPLEAADTPCVLIDLDRVEANLKRAQAHADANGYRLRPHTKTHKLPRFAQQQLDLGARGITVQKLGEAEVMVEGGITDIFLPYNILGAAKLKRLRALNEGVTLAVTADSAETVIGYSETFAEAGKPLTVLVECDTGGGRVGVQSQADALALARRIVKSPGLRFGGLMTYPPAGAQLRVTDWLRAARDMIEDAGIDVPVISSGNSPDMWDKADGVVTERRPGTYIYYDRWQVVKGVATVEDCALSVLVTVVSRPTPTRAVIDAGSKTLSSDLLGMEGYGVIFGTQVQVAGVSEEHGVINFPEPTLTPRVGDRLRILPNHACVVSNLFDHVQLVRGGEIIETVRVAGRGRVD